MILNKIKSKELNGGFTIVELLVVIVVIGILAGITVVSYTGITAKANLAAAKQNASSVATAADAYFAENQTYPASGSLSTGTVKVPSNISIIATIPVTGTPAAITYKQDATGYCVQYWDVVATAKATFASAGSTGAGLCF